MLQLWAVYFVITHMCTLCGWWGVALVLSNACARTRVLALEPVSE